MNVKLDDSWKKHLNHHLNSEGFKNLVDFVKSEYKLSYVGNCSPEQVGVNAPGKLNRTTLLPLNNSSVVLSTHEPPMKVQPPFSSVSPVLNLNVCSFSYNCIIYSPSNNK